MSKFHRIVFDEIHKDGMRLTADEKVNKDSGLWIFRKTIREGNKDITAVSCTVSEHEDLAPFECYVENVFIDRKRKGFFWRVMYFLFRRNYEESALRDLQKIFESFHFHTVYFERSLDEDAKLIKWSVDGGKVGTGNTMKFR